RYFHSAYRRREISSRGQPVPELVEIPFQVLLKLGDRLPVHPGRTFVGSNLPVCLPHQPLRDIKRLLLQVTHSFLPFPVDSRIPCGWPAPFAPPPLQQLRHYYEAV